MARSRKRKNSAANPDEDSKKNKSEEMWGNGGSSRSRKGSSSHGRSSSGSSAANNQLAASLKLFDSYTDEEDPTLINMEGISKLCEDVGIDPLEDIRVLVLMWKLNATEKPGHITKDEWTKGCETLGIDSIETIKKMLPSLDTGFLDSEEFKDFYKFAFQFNREGTHRTLDKSLVTALQQLILAGRIDEKRLTTWIEFLDQLKGENYSRITLDQWTSFLDFCLECEDLDTDYDEENSAWPVLIDEYVEYMKNKQC